jgi:ketosteroid isomerase-like protein
MRSSHVTALAAIAIVALPTAASGTDGTPTPGGGAGSAARARYTSGPAGLTATPVTDPTARKKPVTRTEILNRMVAAINAHDLDAFVSLYAEDVVSEAPIHPGMSFVGRENVRRNWAGIFARVPDIRATVQQSVADGDQVWSEWEMGGTTVDGEPYLTRGVAILRLRHERIASVRFYLDSVDIESGDQSTQRVSRHTR